MESKGLSTIRNRQATLRDLFEKQKSEIAKAIPNHLSSDVLLRIALTTIFSSPKLMQADPRSLLSSVMSASALGLKLDPELGQAWLVPFDTRRGMQAKLMLGWRGLVDLVRRSGSVAAFYAYCVYENDDFDIQLGLNTDLKHTPARGDRGEFIAAYAVIKMKDGTNDFEWMYKDEIDKVRKTSKAKSDGPWFSWYSEMARKTVIKRLAKRAPISADLADVHRAVSIDDKAEAGVIEVDFSEGARVGAEKQIEKVPPPIDAPVHQCTECKFSTVSPIGFKRHVNKNHPMYEVGDDLVMRPKQIEETIQHKNELNETLDQVAADADEIDPKEQEAHEKGLMIYELETHYAVELEIVREALNISDNYALDELNFDLVQTIYDRCIKKG